MADDEEEEKEKYTLSISILNFLKIVSLDPKLCVLLENQESVLSKVLFAE